MGRRTRAPGTGTSVFLNIGRGERMGPPNETTRPAAEQNAPEKTDPPNVAPCRGTINVGWFKAMRNSEAIELIKANPKAFILLYVIAYRAQWHPGFNRYN